MADITSLSESSQALFCALGEYINIKGKSVDTYFSKTTNPDFLKFEESWTKDFKKAEDSIESIYGKFTRTASGSQNLSYGDIKDFLILKKDWYISSISIADKFIKDVAKVPGLKAFNNKPSLSEIWYYRGDSEVMLNIASLFTIANANAGSPFGDLNKWSPADIYFADKLAKVEIKRSLDHYKRNSGQYGFDILNNMISSLMDKGYLLPISLKKQTGNVIIKAVNFDREKEEQEILELGFTKFRQPWKKSTAKKPETRDLQVQVTSSKAEYIQIRHDASNGEKSDGFKSEFFGGGEGKGGGVSSIKVFSKIFAQIDSGAAATFQATWRSGSDEYKKIMKSKRAKLEADLTKSKSTEAQKLIKKAFDEDRGLTSAMCVTNPAFVFMISWLNSNDKLIKNDPLIISPADRLVQQLYKYITSRTEISSKFIIMK